MPRSPASPSTILDGRREQALLAFSSVQHLANLLVVRFREPSWVRTIVASLARFRSLTGQADLEQVLAQARQDAQVAEDGLLRLARALVGYTDSQVAALAIGPKIWFRLNGVPVSWRVGVLCLANVNLLTMIPVVPGNLGTYEAAVVIAYRSVGLSAEQALGIALVQHACYLVGFALPGCIWLAGMSMSRRAAAAR